MSRTHAEIKNTNYSMPAEWYRHSATQLHWPVGSESWNDLTREKVEQVYCHVIEELHFFEPIHLFVGSLEFRDHVMQKLSKLAIDLDRIIIHQQPIDSVRARDCGPIFVNTESGFKITDWGYNAIRKKRESRENNNAIPQYVANKYNVDHIQIDKVLEGGSIDVNGQGSLLTTESCLLNSNRNAHVSKIEIENYLNQYLGAKQIIWLKNGLKESVTDGHIDEVTRWLNDETVLTSITEDKSNSNYRILKENLETLRSVILPNGNKLKVEVLPVIDLDSSEVLASYSGFYIVNGAVLVPQYGGKDDQDALNLFNTYFSSRKIIGIDSKDLAPLNLSLHTITKQWHVM